MDSGLIGGIVGSAIGVLGGIVGTYFSIKNTQGPNERAFMVKVSIIGWGALILFFALMILLPHPYRHFLWIPYGVLLPLGIIKGNRIQAELRKMESENGAQETG